MINAQRRLKEWLYVGEADNHLIGREDDKEKEKLLREAIALSDENEEELLRQAIALSLEDW